MPWPSLHHKPTIRGMQRVSSKTDHNGDLAAFGAIVRARRKELGLSQEALADLAEIDRSHMGRIERGERNVSVLNVIRVARAIGVLPSELLRQSGL